jgi:hypothetical protein
VGRIRQGDIFREIEYVEYVTERRGIIEVSKILFPLVIVLSQDCDLEQDYRLTQDPPKATSQDKRLLSVLVAPLYNLEHVITGEHLSELSMQMAPINLKKTPGEYLLSNQRPRYHYLEFPPEVPIVPAVIDFKHYFTVNVQHLAKLRRSHFVCSVSPVFREDVSQRFASFLARIGLP